jgi:serine/threonine protein kinase
MIIRSDPNWPPYLWHHRVHTEKRRERLFYWRIGFEGGYERDRVAAGIDSACSRTGIKAFIVYELFGAYDLLIRTWMPPDRHFDEFENVLTGELESTNLEMCDAFEVDYMIRHWPFSDEHGEPLPPPEERRIGRLQDSEIDEVDTKWPDVRPELLERLIDERLLTPLNHTTFERPGIKFAIDVSSEGPTDARKLADFEQELLELVDRASGISQRSLYAGSGYAHFMIMGRVDYEAFHAIHSELVSQINTAALSERYRARTVTHVSGQRGYRIAREALTGRSGRVARIIGGRIPQRRIGKAHDPERVMENGETFAGRFEIVAHLGGGGFANVYAARDAYEGGVKRALKVFRSANREVALREIGALRRINQSNVVKVLWGEHDGPLWYLVTEFVDGKSLDECEQGGDARALSIIIQVLRGLEAVHPDDARISELRSKDELSGDELVELQALQDKGLVHRDIKPENIMVSDDGHVTIVDFNIASPARQPGKTRSGTPGYMAPDAGVGGWEPSDDLFSCGVMLYELLMGTHPFVNREPVGGAAPADPRGSRPDLPDSLADVVVHSCQTIRADRYQSAAEMRKALERELAAVEKLESTVRLALWQWQKERSRPRPADTGESAEARPPITDGPLSFARILIDRVENPPFESDVQSSSLPPSDDDDPDKPVPTGKDDGVDDESASA